MIEHFPSPGLGWQARIYEVLRRHVVMETRRRVAEERDVRPRVAEEREEWGGGEGK